MIKITIDDREVQKALQSLVDKVKDRRPLMRNIAGIMHDAVEQNFEAEGRPRWEPSPDTTASSITALIFSVLCISARPIQMISD